MKSSVLLIANPVAGSYKEMKIRKAIRGLEEKGLGVELFITLRKGDAQERAYKAKEEQFAFVLAAGGDGTINEVVNGLALSSIPLSILPSGSSDVLSKEIGIPPDTEKALQVITEGRVHRISLGRIVNAQGESRYFTVMAGIGFDGAAVRGIDEGIKRFSGKLAHIVSGLRHLAEYRPELLAFDMDGATSEGYTVVAANASRYGGNFQIAPGADITSGDLTVCVFKGNTRQDVIRYAAGVLLGRHLHYPDVVRLQGKALNLRGTAHIQIDGEYFGTSPARIEIVPDALSLIYR